MQRNCKNPEPIISASNWKPHVNYSEPNEGIQIDFGGLITKKIQEIFFFACIDRFAKYSTLKVLEKTNGHIVVKFSNIYIKIQ